jgi:hypothetical protein
VSDFGQSTDDGLQLGALVGWTSILGLESDVVRGIHAKEYTASRGSIGATVVATSTVGGDDDCTAVRPALSATSAHIAVNARDHVDHFVQSRAPAYRTTIAAASYKALISDVAFVVFPVVVAPDTRRVPAAIDGCCLIVVGVRDFYR